RAFSLKKAERILKRDDFKRLFQCGKKIHRDHFVVYYCRNSLGILRMGVTVSKRVGRAVIRNRIKRLVRESFRLNKALCDHACDMNIIAKTGAAELSFQETDQALGNIFKEISKDCKHEASALVPH
ncbi:MAG: ribonuclease P protein component, partial [Thermodesulfobacteriota bacterium]|nr:ribonuclease P protein component [Thermodesulfobacteriota bacterium]